MASLVSSLQPFHKQFPDKFRSQTIFGRYEKIYRRPPSVKHNSKEFKRLQAEEKIKLSKVCNFDDIANNEPHHQNNITLLSAKNGLKMYGYKTFPGLFYIPNYLSTQQQFEWIKQSIEEFSNAPYTNLSNLNAQQNNKNKPPTWKDAVTQNSLKSFRRLTWANVGIQYDWTERRYNLDNVTAPIPQSMLDLCSDCNDLLTHLPIEHSEQKTDDNRIPFSMQIIPQTSIINFFEVNTKRPMGGHKDAAELINAPLISVSLGNDAIFLISNDDDIEPLPLRLTSGCVLIMAANARFALHCVARVVTDSLPTQLSKYFENEINDESNHIRKQELKLMKQYIMDSRINFNIRQVIDVNKVPKYEHSDKQTKDFHEIHSF